MSRDSQGKAEDIAGKGVRSAGEDTFLRRSLSHFAIILAILWVFGIAFIFYIRFAALFYRIR